MATSIDHDRLNEALRRCGSTWEAAQVHGLLCSRLAAEGRAAGRQWLEQVLEGRDPASVASRECEMLLEAVFRRSYEQLAERQSEFELLLPDDQASVAERTGMLAQWCEGFLHGLVSGQRNDRVRDKLAAEPLADLIKDLLQITRAEVGSEDDDQSNEQAFIELVEYVRVGAQLAYEELALLRDEANGGDGVNQIAESLH